MENKTTDFFELKDTKEWTDLIAKQACNGEWTRNMTIEAIVSLGEDAIDYTHKNLIYRLHETEKELDQMTRNWFELKEQNKKMQERINCLLMQKHNLL